MSGEITRVGIVAKRGLRAAGDHLGHLSSWLRDRGIEPIFETDTGSLIDARGETRSRDDLPRDVDLVTIDVSFISLRQILPAVTPVLRPGADVVALVKPQFEAGRAEVRKGVIRDEAVHARVMDEVADAGAEVGLARLASTPSPITGQKGNLEFLLHLRQR